MRTDGSTVYVQEAAAPSLGFTAEGAYDEQQASLERGDMVVLYTDGLIERRGEDLSVGLDRLRSTVERADADAEALASRIEAEVRDGMRADDIALLVAQHLAD